jgi:hypothetical protein
MPSRGPRTGGFKTRPMISPQSRRERGGKVFFDLRGDDRKSKRLIPSGNRHVARNVILEREGF